ncbi:hypothetical protein H920_04708 [Fukomys damarensis]|uniref:Uncharacterized protein n=1 Tax=Fukomys damarensis TaxID=885580 RepID=A0A091DNN8_FUKDA|nr:hypothetical protein H920_04708 [Fukomys damarensis]
MLCVAGSQQVGPEQGPGIEAAIGEQSVKPAVKKDSAEPKQGGHRCLERLEGKILGEAVQRPELERQLGSLGTAYRNGPPFQGTFRLFEEEDVVGPGSWKALTSCHPADTAVDTAGDADLTSRKCGPGKS